MVLKSSFKGVGVREQEDGLELDTQARSFTDPHKRWRRTLVQGILSLGFIAMACALLWEHRDIYLYALRAKSAPIAVGDVSEHTPSDLLHNSYVEIEGITEHRALKQERMRGLSFNRQTYWYFRLLGSRGVFIEVPADSTQYDATMRVHVQGRVLDPSRSSGYQDILKRYEEVFFQKPSGDIRIVQVGVYPSGQRAGAVGVLVGLFAMVGWNVWVLRRVWLGR